MAPLEMVVGHVGVPRKRSQVGRGDGKIASKRGLR